MKKITLFLVILWTAGILAGCAVYDPTQSNPVTVPPGLFTWTPEISPTRELPTPTTTVQATQTSTTTLTNTHTATVSLTPEPVGPDDYPPGVNPLSGLPVQEPENLSLPPALVSISNSPANTRPQAGLSYSPLVFELYIGVGASRYLAVFYGDYPQLTKGSPGDMEFGYSEAMIGPIRSGRLPYETLRKIYNGFLVFASASIRVLPHLDDYYILYNEDLENYNTAVLESDRLLEMARQELPQKSMRSLLGLRYDSSIPPGGELGERVWVPFHQLNQAIWEFDPDSGSYHRYQDKEDGETFEQMVDRLSGDPLAFENIIILFADYTFFDVTLFDINLMYLRRFPALLFRDGNMYEIFWTTGNEAFERETGFLRPIRFVDREGNPFPLKHGQTWVTLIPRHSPYYEISRANEYSGLRRTREDGTGHWLVYFQQPFIPEIIPTDEPED